MNPYCFRNNSVKLSSCVTLFAWGYFNKLVTNPCESCLISLHDAFSFMTSKCSIAAALPVKIVNRYEFQRKKKQLCNLVNSLQINSSCDTTHHRRSSKSFIFIDLKTTLVILNRPPSQHNRSWKRNKQVSDHGGIPLNKYST